MRKKPKGRKYRNLHARGNVIYYEREWRKKRTKQSTYTSDWEIAVAFRDDFEQKMGIGTSQLRIPRKTTFREFAKERYIREEVKNLAHTTQVERVRELRADGPIMKFFGDYRLDEILTDTLTVFWNRAVIGRERKVKTGRNYLDVVSGVLGYAHELKLLSENPIPSYRQILRRKLRTKKGRSQSNVSRDIRPIEIPADLHTLVEAAQTEGTRAHLMVLLLLDAGLRLGEAIGLRWADIGWADGPDDRGRSIHIMVTRPKGGPEDVPKSGLDRKVYLSKRLWWALSWEQQKVGSPNRYSYVLGDTDPDQFRRREWKHILKRADIGRWRLKDLRDTYACQLLSCNVPLGYVSTQLGHSEIATTSSFYAKWIDTDHQQPPVLGPTEVYADFLARLGKSHQSPTTDELGEVEDIENLVESQELVWHAGRDSNPRPSGSKTDPDARSDA